ncbi:MAG: hypothetical protein K2Q18_01545 [Bdellovibrionales bacterium]|nr:hypothetical protein [Bdellovibrionales bacterium]
MTQTEESKNTFFRILDNIAAKIVCFFRFDKIADLTYKNFTLPIMSGYFINDLFHKMLSLEKKGWVFIILLWMVAFNSLVKSKKHAFYFYLTIISFLIVIMNMFEVDPAWSIVIIAFILIFGLRTFFACLSLKDEVKVGSNRIELFFAGISLIFFNLLSEDFIIDTHKIFINFNMTSDQFLQILPLSLGALLLLLIFISLFRKNKIEEKKITS